MMKKKPINFNFPFFFFSLFSSLRINHARNGLLELLKKKKKKNIIIIIIIIFTLP